MSDWQPGDLALCVRKGWAPDDPTKPGALYVVESLFTNPVDSFLCLRLMGVRSTGRGWDGLRALRFRKIGPHAPDAEDLRTIALLNRENVDA